MTSNNSDRAVSASIVLYNTSRIDIGNCLRSLELCQDLGLIYIVDNSPTDGLSDLFDGSKIVYIHNPANPGFGGGHNIAIAKSAQAGYRYHLVLNADISFDEDVLAPMLSYMDLHRDVGQMMPCVRNPDGSLQRLCKLVPTPADLLFRRFLPKRLRDARNKHFELHDSGYDRIMFVPYLSGCFMLLRHEVLQQIGVFDERFFMYPEDIDLTRRIAEGFSTIYYPLVSVVHQHGAASHKSLRMFLVHAENIARYFNKWGWLHDPVRDQLNDKTLRQFLNRDFSNHIVP
jgi:GT2 family glycosyltransferase